jgi:S-adenosyl-L-methionine hydrolase (adenosine-forming)
MIATFTDFGLAGPYLGQVRAVLYQRAPGVPVVDVFADLPAFNVRASAYLLPAYSQYLPAGSICLCVVDPGVGGERGVLAVEADGRWYVGPDNGLLSQVIRRTAGVSVFSISWRPDTLSSSFHGRDLFAPVCAMLASGERPPGEPVDAVKFARPDWPDDLHEVVYVDSYGNAVTGLRATQLTSTSRVEIAGRVCGHRRTFCEAPPETPFWYANANGLVEIAVSGASAHTALGIEVGQDFRLIHSP